MVKKRIFDIATRDLDKILCTSLTKVVDNILELEKEWSEKGWTSLHIKAEYQGYEGGVEYILCGMREETDEEYNQRLLTEKKQTEKEKKNTFTKAKKEYNILLGTGMFWEFFPNYSGDWEKDKGMFLDFYKNRENGRKD